MIMHWTAQMWSVNACVGVCEQERKGGEENMNPEMCLQRSTGATRSFHCGEMCRLYPEGKGADRGGFLSRGEL